MSNCIDKTKIEIDFDSENIIEKLERIKELLTEINALSNEIFGKQNN